MRLIIIGGVAAGAKAAMKARRQNPALEILIVQNEAHVAYSACAMPFVLSGVIADVQDMLIRGVEEFQKHNIQVLTEHQVISINPASQSLEVVNLKNQQQQNLHYDRLILATGAKPFIPKLPGVELEGVCTLRNVNHLLQIQTFLKKYPVKNAVIVGGGFIGLELAEAFVHLGVNVTLLEKANQLMPSFDNELAALLVEKLQTNGVQVLLEDSLTAIQGEQRVSSITTDSGKELTCDLLILSLGIKPNTELAVAAGIHLGTTQAIAVNSQMMTNLDLIYAAGDCAETVNRITGKPCWLPLGDIANLQGRIAGENAAGGNAHFPGVLGTAIVKLFDWQIASTGLTESAARQNGFNANSIVIEGKNKARYYPECKNFKLKLVADADNGRILGAQAVGEEGVHHAIDIVATALLGELTLDDLENADLAYSPPFSQVLSPVIVASGALNNKLNSNTQTNSKPVEERK